MVLILYLAVLLPQAVAVAVHNKMLPWDKMVVVAAVGRVTVVVAVLQVQGELAYQVKVFLAETEKLRGLIVLAAVAVLVQLVILPF
jgi:hypothetical protein